MAQATANLVASETPPAVTSVTLANGKSVQLVAPVIPTQAVAVQVPVDTPAAAPIALAVSLTGDTAYALHSCIRGSACGPKRL